ncbi:hypothetical protein EMPG_13524 [Blastomyces silverae]|uniref:Uncharacterized protein n=1 Tax=Blastomyces silverae TaxID=2060906 RepID=A0A0H1BJG9_9EURO|nr:hypothetical protein EMPG_13524 [Blastomyces silverae]
MLGITEAENRRDPLAGMWTKSIGFTKNFGISMGFCLSTCPRRFYRNPRTPRPRIETKRLHGGVLVILAKQTRTNKANRPIIGACQAKKLPR